MEYRKAFVDVVVKCEKKGERWIKTPLSLVFDDEERSRFEIDKVTDRRRMAATKVGGTGIRYTIFIGGRERYLFEDEGAWFVEAIVPRNANKMMR